MRTSRDWRDSGTRLRSHRGRDAAADRERDPARAGGAPAARRRVRHRLAEDAAAPRESPHCESAGCNVTSVHPMFGPDTELLSGRHVIFIDVGCQRGGRGRAGAVRLDDGGAGRHEPRRARSPDRLRARPVACTEHRVLHCAGRKRRGRAAAGAAVEHDLRRAGRRGDRRSRAKARNCISRSSISTSTVANRCRRCAAPWSAVAVGHDGRRAASSPR